MKFSENVDNGPRKTSLDFGDISVSRKDFGKAGLHSQNVCVLPGYHKHLIFIFALGV